MIDIFTQSFLGMWKSMPTARVKLRRNQYMIDKALSRGQWHQRERTEQGQFEEANVTVRFLATDESPIAPMTLDALIELQPYQSEQWRKYRIAERRDQAGLVLLMLETPYE
jgi:hypothetical protein